MGNTSSQPGTQHAAAVSQTVSSSPPDQVDRVITRTLIMESPQVDTATAQTPGTAKTKAGKLKTYAKQRASSGSKPMRSSARIRAASEEIGEQYTPAKPDIPQTIDETPVQAKAARKTRKRKADAAAPVVDEAMAADAAAEEEITEQPTKTRKRKSKKQSIQAEEEQEVEVPETQEPDEEQADQDSGERPSELEQQAYEDAVEEEPEAEAGALDAEPEDPMDNTEGDISQFEVPPDSDNDMEQSQPSSAKPKTKRKRQSIENGESPAPAVKRVKRSSMPRASVGDFPEQGPFTPVECDLIESHMLMFCRDHELSRDQLIGMIQASSREMSKVYVDLATEILPHRNRRAVQRYCRRHYNNFQRGRWTEEQDELLRTAFAETPNKWVKIGERVGRMPEDCRDRWRNHVSLDQRHTDVWTQDEEQKLANAVSECLRSVQATMDTTLSREIEDDYIAWSVVVQKMNGSRNRLQCSMKWRKIKARVIREENAQHEREAAIERGDIMREPDELYDDGMTSPHTTTRWKAEAARRFDEMTVGDMLDVTRETLYGAQMGAFSSKNTFWAVVTRLHAGSPWTTADRKIVYKRMRDNVGDVHDFKSNLENQVAWFESHFDPEALAVRTAPRHRLQHNGRRSTGTFRSEEKVQESDEEGDLTMPSLGVEQQINEEMADAVSHAGDDANFGTEEEVELNGNGNGYVDEQEQEPEVPESEHEEADYN